MKQEHGIISNAEGTKRTDQGIEDLSASIMWYVAEALRAGGPYSQSLTAGRESHNVAHLPYTT